MVTPLPPHPALSAQHNKVLAMLSVGMRTHQIAEELVIAPKTVKAYIRRMARKLGIEVDSGVDARLLVLRKATEDLMLPKA
jgi:DNA-binding NarL/FixJ family response regulator